MASTEAICQGFIPLESGIAMRILIVDDHALTRRCIAHVVKEGFLDSDVVEAGSAPSALELMREGPPSSRCRMSACQTPTVWSCSARSRPNGRSCPSCLDLPGPPNVRHALADDVAGYLLKDATPEDSPRRSTSRSPAAETSCRLA